MGANTVGDGATCRQGSGGVVVLPNGGSITRADLSTAPVTPFRTLNVTLRLTPAPGGATAAVGDGAVVAVSPVTFAAHNNTCSPVLAKNGAVMKTAPMSGL